MLKFKPIYTCDGCGTELENPDQIRIFAELVKNGDGTKIYIDQETMYCLNCIPLALDFENVCPGTVKIVERPELEKPTEKVVEKVVKENLITAEELEQHLSEITNRFIYVLETHQKKIDLLLETVNSLREETSSNQEISRSIDIVVDDITTEAELKAEEESELGKSIYKEETRDLIDLIPTETFGDYILLKCIESEEDKEELAKKCGYKDVNSLNEVFGKKSPIGIYYSLDKYTNTLQILNGDYQRKTVKLINKILFGVPNVAEKPAYVYSDTKFALIEKRLFDDKVEIASEAATKIQKSSATTSKRLEEVLKRKLLFKNDDVMRDNDDDDYI